MITLRQAFEKKYPKYIKIIDRFQEATGCECEWDNITKANLYEFANYMTDKVARTSARTYMAMFKSVLNLYADSVQLPKGWDDVLAVKKDVSQNVFLNEKEIKKIIGYKPTSRNEQIVRCLFLLSCLTGARHSDAMNFTESNIEDGMLVYVSKKTHIEARIPVAPIVHDIISEITANNLRGDEMSDPTYNSNIRSICKAVGINSNVKLYNGGAYQEGEKWEFVASHTARRSFATNLYQRGADLYSISKLMGHASTQQTESYIVGGIRELPDKVLSFFSNFK